MFLGYVDGVKGYRLWCTKLGKQGCIISWDVLYDETCFPYLTKRITQNPRGQAREDNTKVEVELPLNNPRQPAEHNDQMPQERGEI